MSVRYVGMPLVKARNLLNIRESTRVRNPMNVRNVKRLFVLAQTLLDIREFILVRSPMNVRYVGKPILRVHNLLVIIEFILVRRPMNIGNVQRPLIMTHNWFNIKICTGDKTEYTKCVQRLLFTAQNYLTSTTQQKRVYLNINPSK